MSQYSSDRCTLYSSSNSVCCNANKLVHGNKCIEFDAETEESTVILNLATFECATLTITSADTSTADVTIHVSSALFGTSNTIIAPDTTKKVEIPRSSIVTLLITAGDTFTGSICYIIYQKVPTTIGDCCSCNKSTISNLSGSCNNGLVNTITNYCR